MNPQILPTTVIQLNVRIIWKATTTSLETRLSMYLHRVLSCILLGKGKAHLYLAFFLLGNSLGSFIQSWHQKWHPAVLLAQPVEWTLTTFPTRTSNFKQIINRICLPWFSRPSQVRTMKNFPDFSDLIIKKIIAAFQSFPRTLSFIAGSATLRLLCQGLSSNSQLFYSQNRWWVSQISLGSTHWKY